MDNKKTKVFPAKGSDTPRLLPREHCAYPMPDWRYMGKHKCMNVKVQTRNKSVQHRVNKSNKSTQYNSNKDKEDEIFDFWPNVLYIIFVIYVALLAFALWSQYSYRQS